MSFTTLQLTACTDLHSAFFCDSSPTDNQFGLKKGHSTVIQYYKSNNSPVYSCFLDASKAFDRVNHWTLFIKLLNRGVPAVLIRILLYWYRTQTFCIKGVLQHHTFLMFRMVFDKVGFRPHIYLSCTLISEQYAK